jgi:hypothetical protein
VFSNINEYQKNNPDLYSDPWKVVERLWIQAGIFAGAALGLSFVLWLLRK